MVVTAGRPHFAPLTSFTPAQFRVGLDSKLIGQVNVALVAQEYFSDGWITMWPSLHKRTT